jgi:hypothetical protein
VDFLVWLRREHGASAIPTLVRQMREGKPLSEAIFLATGQDLDSVDGAWRAQLASSSQAAWLQTVAAEGPWIAAALLGTVAMFQARRRQRQRRDEIAERERREDAMLREAARRRSDPLRQGFGTPVSWP